MKKLIILAAAAIAAVACSRTFDTAPAKEQAIGFGTWTETLTKAPLTAFVANDEFDVYGFKWNEGPANQTNVFTGDDVKFDGTDWSYSPLRFWDKNFDNYTFFASFPKDVLAAEAVTDDYPQKGLFISNDLTYNGNQEQLLIAQKKDVAKSSYGTSSVALVFKHTGALVDIKFKKHTDLSAASVTVTSIAISDVQTKGHFTVASYDSNKNPVGKTVSSVEGLGWEVADPAVPNATPAAAPYLNNSGVTLAADAGVGTSNAADLITNLVVMPQVLAKTSGPKITISYTITTGTGGDAQTITYTDKTFYFGEFDKSDPDPTEKDNADPRISSWMPNVHYTYYITINANAIEFSASIDPWTTTDATGHYYLLN